MAINIRNFSHQEMLIGTPYRLNIRITGNPTDVSVDGLPDNFYYHWNSSRNRVQIRGTPENYVVDKEMVVTADDRVRRQTYSVVPFSPEFNQNIRQNVTRGVKFTLPVSVNNVYSHAEVIGPYIGLSDDINPDGFSLYGTIPEDANFTTDVFVFRTNVSNYSGTTTGTITLVPQALGDTNFYILEGNTIREYPVVVPIEGIDQTLTQTKSFTAPSIPGTTANYVSIASDETNLYLLHSSGGSSDVNNLDDQVVVVSPATQNGQTAGIIRRFDITRHSTFYTHDIEDFYYRDNHLYILTSEVTPTHYQSYYVRYPISNPNGVRIINLLERGGGISITQDYVTAVLFSRNSPNQGNRFTIYPPSYTDGLTLISESHQVYTTRDVIRSDFNINTNDVSMTSVNNFSYILSSTLPNVLSVVELPTPVSNPIRRGEITLDPALTSTQGITHL